MYEEGDGRLLSELVILILCLWTRGSEQVLRRRGGYHICQTVLYDLSGGCSAAPAGTESGPDAGTAAPDRVGKASPSVSIFARAPLCQNTCRHCRCKLCDIATDHDDHICCNCEQRQLFPERIPKWEISDQPICDSWCQECATQRCCTRGAHKYHLCMKCERRGVVFLAPARGEDPWAAKED